MFLYAEAIIVICAYYFELENDFLNWFLHLNRSAVPSALKSSMTLLLRLESLFSQPVFRLVFILKQKNIKKFSSTFFYCAITVLVTITQAMVTKWELCKLFFSYSVNKNLLTKLLLHDEIKIKDAAERTNEWLK